MLHNFNNKKISSLVAGFGLIELMVSISIVVLVTSIIMVRHSSYNGAVLLRSQAYEVALQIREIQLSAVSAVLVSGVSRNILGVYLDTSNPSYYYNFYDSDASYTFTSGEEFGKRNNIDKRFEISQIRWMDCGTLFTTQPITSIIFERPNFDAEFYSFLGTPAPSNVSAVEIDIRVKGTSGSGLGEVRTVEVSRTGQITVQ